MFIPRHETGQISSGAQYALASMGGVGGEKNELAQARLRRKRRQARRQMTITKIKVGWS